MKKCLWILLILISINSFAAEVNCFSKKTRIYHGWGHDFAFNNNFVSFIEYGTHHLIIVSAECLIMVPIDQGEKFNAVSLGEKSTVA